MEVKKPAPPPTIEQSLRDKDLMKASLVFEVPIETLRMMNGLNILNVPRIRSVLIRQDFLNYKRAIKDKPEFTEAEILEALCREYKEPLKYISECVYKNFQGKMYFCRMCGKRISKPLAARTGGLCTSCNSELLPSY